jgi:hypothetical protein
MIDLTDFATRVNIGMGLALIALLLFFIFIAKFPTKKSSKR